VVTPTTARMLRRRHRIGTVTARKKGSIAAVVVDCGCGSPREWAVMFSYIKNAPAAVARAAST